MLMEQAPFLILLYKHNNMWNSKKRQVKFDFT